MGEDFEKGYQKGRYDELVESHKKLLEMYHNLEWHALTNVPRAGISGASVSYHSGVQINPKVIGGTLGGTGITFSILAYLLGLVPTTFGVSLAMFGLLYGVLTYLLKEPEEDDMNRFALPRLPPKGA
jgi:hypothetical protein